MTRLELRRLYRLRSAVRAPRPRDRWRAPRKVRDVAEVLREAMQDSNKPDAFGPAPSVADQYWDEDTSLVSQYVAAFSIRQVVPSWPAIL